MPESLLDLHAKVGLIRFLGLGLITELPLCKDYRVFFLSTDGHHLGQLK